MDLLRIGNPEFEKEAFGAGIGRMLTKAPGWLGRAFSKSPSREGLFSSPSRFFLGKASERARPAMSRMGRNFKDYTLNPLSMAMSGGFLYSASRPTAGAGAARVFGRRPGMPR